MFLDSLAVTRCVYVIGIISVSIPLFHNQLSICVPIYCTDFLFLCMYVYMYVCMYLFIWKQGFSVYPCPGIYSVDQAGLQLRNLPASAFQVLGLKACSTNCLAILQVFYCNRWLWLSRVFVLGAGNYPFKVYYKLLF